MPSFNQVTLMGNLTRDPELKYIPSGAAVCTFSIAVNEKYTSNGEKREEVLYMECETWQKTAETVSKYLSKGSGVLVSGKLKMDTWEDKDSGKNRSKIKVRVMTVQFLGKPGGEKREGDRGNKEDRTNSDDLDDADIPF